MRSAQSREPTRHFSGPQGRRGRVSFGIVAMARLLRRTESKGNLIGFTCRILLGYYVSASHTYLEQRTELSSMQKFKSLDTKSWPSYGELKIDRCITGSEYKLPVVLLLHRYPTPLLTHSFEASKPLHPPAATAGPSGPLYAEARGGCEGQECRQANTPAAL